MMIGLALMTQIAVAGQGRQGNMERGENHQGNQNRYYSDRGPDKHNGPGKGHDKHKGNGYGHYKGHGHGHQKHGHGHYDARPVYRHSTVVVRPAAPRPVHRQVSVVYHRTVRPRVYADVRVDVGRPVVVARPYEGGREMSVREMEYLLYDMEMTRGDMRRYELAKEAIKGRAVYAEDVAAIMMRLEFEDHRLAFAKRAYRRTIDTENYRLVFDQLHFGSSKHELRDYIRH